MFFLLCIGTNAVSEILTGHLIRELDVSRDCKINDPCQAVYKFGFTARLIAKPVASGWSSPAKVTRISRKRPSVKKCDC